LTSLLLICFAKWCSVTVLALAVETRSAERDLASAEQFMQR
jgi:hypothetical protein